MKLLSSLTINTFVLKAFQRLAKLFVVYSTLHFLDFIFYILYIIISFEITIIHRSGDE